jgi:hypothetical protein
MKKLIIFIGCVLLTWVCGSWWEVAINNTTPNHEYSQVNFFNLFQQEEKENADTMVYDTSALANWCGEPTGTVRMIGAWFTDDGYIEDEAGNLWVYDFQNEIQKDTFSQTFVKLYKNYFQQVAQNQGEIFVYLAQKLFSASCTKRREHFCAE